MSNGKHPCPACHGDGFLLDADDPVICPRWWRHIPMRVYLFGLRAWRVYGP